MTVNDEFIGEMNDISLDRYFNGRTNCENVPKSTGQEFLKINGKTAKSNDTNLSRTCSNCGTSCTSTWRNLGEHIVCNACKCFYRKHGRNRPIHMRKDKIVTRHRKACKLTVPNECMFHMNDESNLQSSEPDSKIVAEAVCMMLHYLQSL